MNRTVIIAIPIAAVLLLGGGTLLVVNRLGQNHAAVVSTDMGKKFAKTPASQPMATNSVTLQNFAFSPVNITVQKGTTVTWTNQDSVTHTVTADSGPSPNSQPLAKGDSYSYTFDSVGTFSYHCTPHPYMKATVTVTAK